MQIEKLRAYIPWNEQEERDKAVMLKFMEHQKDIYLRKNALAHFSASAWVVNRKHTKVLLIYHNIYHSWSWIGGHADGDKDLLGVAMGEVKEETGVTNVRPLSEELFSIEILTVDGHEKRGVYVPSHLHMNVTFLLEADEQEELRVKLDENSGVKWFAFDEVKNAVSEPWMQARIYEKLMEKLHIFC